MDPLFRAVQLPRLNFTGADAPDLRRMDQSGILQNPDMFHEGWQSHIERLGQFGDGCRSTGQLLDDGTAGRIGQRMKYHVQHVLMLIHMTKYIGAARTGNGLGGVSEYQTDRFEKSEGDPHLLK